MDAQKPADQIIDDTGPVVEHGFRQAQLKLAEQPQDRNGGKAGVPVAQNRINDRGTHREDHQGKDEPERTVVAPVKQTFQNPPEGKIKGMPPDKETGKEDRCCRQKHHHENVPAEIGDQQGSDPAFQLLTVAAGGVVPVEQCPGQDEEQGNRHPGGYGLKEGNEEGKGRGIGAVIVKGGNVDPEDQHRQNVGHDDLLIPKVGIIRRWGKTLEHPGYLLSVYRIAFAGVTGQNDRARLLPQASALRSSEAADGAYLPPQWVRPW